MAGCEQLSGFIVACAATSLHDEIQACSTMLGVPRNSVLYISTMQRVPLAELRIQGPIDGQPLVLINWPSHADAFIETGGQLPVHPYTAGDGSKEEPMQVDVPQLNPAPEVRSRPCGLLSFCVGSCLPGSDALAGAWHFACRSLPRHSPGIYEGGVRSLHGQSPSKYILLRHSAGLPSKYQSSCESPNVKGSLYLYVTAVCRRSETTLRGVSSSNRNLLKDGVICRRKPLKSQNGEQGIL